MKFYLNSCGIVCALGDGIAEVKQQLFTKTASGISMTDQWSKGQPLPLGFVRSVLPELNQVSDRLRSRNNQLALVAGSRYVRVLTKRSHVLALIE